MSQDACKAASRATHAARSARRRALRAASQSTRACDLLYVVDDVLMSSARQLLGDKHGGVLLQAIGCRVSCVTRWADQATSDLRGRPRGACGERRLPCSKSSPPHTPHGSARSRAPARHSTFSGQPPHSAFACSTPAGVSANHSSGSLSWHGMDHRDEASGRLGIRQKSARNPRVEQVRDRRHDSHCGSPPRVRSGADGWSGPTKRPRIRGLRFRGLRSAQ